MRALLEILKILDNYFTRARIILGASASLTFTVASLIFTVVKLTFTVVKLIFTVVPSAHFLPLSLTFTVVPFGGFLFAGLVVATISTATVAATHTVKSDPQKGPYFSFSEGGASVPSSRG